ncbi:MAG TPA: hypothetical protein VGQ87_01680 [Patescibacteria group bacterium]|jgi:hypothetical protein|nr:hypothetical protein [Patescibacteria group bacterium]
MSSIYLKIFVIVFLFLAEAGSIFSEIMGAKLFISGNFTFWQVFLKFIPILTLTGAFLISGYLLGIKAFQNIWIVSVISITSILILEPILAYSIFRQMPTRGALIGLTLGALGFASALLIK